MTLTVTEFLILQALAQRPGVVKSRNALMDAAYDDQVYVDDRTIDSHIKRLRKKFKVVEPDFEMIETLYGVGYRFRQTSAPAERRWASSSRTPPLWRRPAATRWRKSRLRLRLWRPPPRAEVERFVVADPAHRLAQSRRPRTRWSPASCY